MKKILNANVVITMNKNFEKRKKGFMSGWRSYRDEK